MALKVAPAFLTLPGDCAGAVRFHWQLCAPRRRAEECCTNRPSSFPSADGAVTEVGVTTRVPNLAVFGDLRAPVRIVGVWVVLREPEADPIYDALIVLRSIVSAIDHADLYAFVHARIADRLADREVALRG
jgi:hypothetical protein